MGCQGGGRQGDLFYVSGATLELPACTAGSFVAPSYWKALRIELCTATRDNYDRAPNTPVTQGADAPLIDIEVLSSDSGAPVVEMHGYAAEVMRVVRVQPCRLRTQSACPHACPTTRGALSATICFGLTTLTHCAFSVPMLQLGIEEVKVSISHAAEVAVAQAIAR